MADSPRLFVVVFDTNIFVRMILSRSWRARLVREAWLDGRFVLAASEPILQEVERALHYPEVQRDYRLSEDEIARFLLVVRNIISLTENLYEVETVRADPADDKFLACALEAGADYLVSEDAHLRNLKYYLGVQIVGIGQLASLLSE